jgi:hypothetical protein
MPLRSPATSAASQQRLPTPSRRTRVAGVRSEMGNPHSDARDTNREADTKLATDGVEPRGTTPTPVPVALMAASDRGASRLDVETPPSASTPAILDATLERSVRSWSRAARGFAAGALMLALGASITTRQALERASAPAVGINASMLASMAAPVDRTARALDAASVTDARATSFATSDRASRAASTTNRSDDAAAIDSDASNDRSTATDQDDAATPIVRAGHASISGGIVVFPSTFRPDADGSYDLLIHFHGNTSVVRESAEVAGLNAAVAIVNLGIGSLPYEEHYMMPGSYEALLGAIDRRIAQRGVEDSKLRRVALSAWSAGYGAISTILQVRKGKDDLDAILMLDGIHCGWEDGKLNARQMRPFALAAERAAKGDLLFSITHSEIDPRSYASTGATADYLLDVVGAARKPLDPVANAPIYLSLESMKGAVAHKLEKSMTPTTEGQVGGLHVVGFRGETKEHHMAHLFQMGATLLPELVSRWQTP